MPSDAFKIQADLLYRFLVLNHSAQVQVMPDDHSDVVPLLPIPNRTVKRVSADDSADTRVKVGHRQAFIAAKSPSHSRRAFCFSDVEHAAFSAFNGLSINQFLTDAFKPIIPWPLFEIQIVNQRQK